VLSGSIGVWLGCLTLAVVYTGLSFLHIACALITPAMVTRLGHLRHRNLPDLMALSVDLKRVQPALRLGRLTCLMLLVGLAAIRLVPLFDVWFSGPGFRGWRIWGLTAGLMLLALVFAAVALFLGELVPRRSLGSAAPRLLLWVAPLLRTYVKVLAPLVWLLERVASVGLRLLGLPDAPAPKVSREEIESLVDLGMAEGLLEPVEKHLLKETLRLGDRSVRQIMRPRIDLDAADVGTPADEILGVIAMAGYSRLPIYEGSLDHILGYVHSKDVLRQHYLGWGLDLRRLCRNPLFVPETMTLDRLLVLFREKRDQLAIVVDEYGTTQGMVTLEDVIDELVGGLSPQGTPQHNPPLVVRDDGSWSIDGQLSLAEFLEVIQAETLVEEAPKSVSTVAGLVLEELGRLPKTGDTIDWQGLKFEVADMDGKRIDRVWARWK
jgi:putative hemolysin